MEFSKDTKEPVAEETRQQILQAAEQRFRVYGYNKTTMAEIAKDCSMSAANLYRYFENKLSIGAAFACRCLDEKIVRLQIVVMDRQRGAAERLGAFVHELFNYTHEQWSQSPRMNEMVIAICDARLDLVERHIVEKQELLVALINDGIERGEFDVADPEVTAEAIRSALTMFEVPLFMPLYSRQDFERRAHNLVQLLLQGILKK